MRGESREPRRLRARVLATEFPFQESGLLWGLLLGGVAGAVCVSLVAAFAVAVLVWVVCGLWRVGEPPVLGFCLAMQWVAVVTGFAFQSFVGLYPGLPVVGEIVEAVWLSLFGLLLLALGMRAAMVRLAAPRREAATNEAPPGYDMRRLFWYVIAAYTVNWFVQLNPKLLGGGAEIVANLLLTRLVLLCFLIATVVRRRRGYGYAAVAFVYALLPQLGSGMSNFKEPFFLLLLLLLAAWEPGARAEAARRRNRRLAAGVAGLVGALGVMGLIWEGGIKPLWRPVAMSTPSDASPADRLVALSAVADKAMERFDLVDAVESLASRLSSGAGYFSLVLARVPAVLPHEGGELTSRAAMHVLQPRALFPDKPVLGSDSWLVRTYTGIAAAGDEVGTSIGLGYMAQFYIDFGTVGMLFALFVYGAYLGMLYRIMRAVSPSDDLFGCAVAVLFVQHFISYDGEIAKQVGGLTQTFLIFTVLLHLAGPALLRRLALPTRLPQGPSWRARQVRVPVTPRS